MLLFNKLVSMTCILLCLTIKYNENVFGQQRARVFDSTAVCTSLQNKSILCQKKQEPE